MDFAQDDLFLYMPKVEKNSETIFYSHEAQVH
jgi:hypothetical protein